jgi:hypothetical protein
MMKTAFDEAFAKQVTPRTLLPAEACSELGVASARTRVVKRLPRWLPVLRRWLAGRYPGLHG